MEIFAITNQKGGSGKTTTAVNLAAALGKKKQKVLVIDLDPQANASSWFGINDESKGLLNLFLGETDLTTLIRKTETPNVEIAPSSSWLVGIDKALAGELGPEGILQRQLNKLTQNWNFVLLDCPPALNILTINALTAATKLLIPVEAHILALHGLAQLLKTVEVIQERLNAKLKISGILACRVDMRTRHSQDIIEQLRQKFGELVYATVIRENIRLAEAPSFKQSIIQYDPTSNGAIDYLSLATEFLNRETTSMKGKHK